MVVCDSVVGATPGAKQVRSSMTMADLGPTPVGRWPLHTSVAWPLGVCTKIESVAVTAPNGGVAMEHQGERGRPAREDP